jgi:hypothetical protein
VATTPNIQARVSIKGADDVRAEFERMRDSGVRSFDKVRESAGKVGSSASTSVKLATSAVNGAASAVGGAVSVVTGTISALTSGLGFALDLAEKIAIAGGVTGVIAGAGFGGLTAALKDYTKTTAEAVEGTAALGAEFSMSTQTASKWQALLRLQGGEADEVERAFSSLQKAYLKASEGDEAALAFFQNVGLAGKQLRDAQGGLLRFPDLLERVSTNLSQVSNSALRSKAGVQLFGKDAGTMIDILEKGPTAFSKLLTEMRKFDQSRDAKSAAADAREEADALREQIDEIDRYGTVVPQSLEDVTSEYLDNTRKLAEAWRGLGMVLVNAFAPIFTESAKGYTDWLVDNKKRIQEFADWAAETFSNITDDLKEMFLGERDVEDRSSADAKTASNSDDEEEDDTATSGAITSGGGGKKGEKFNYSIFKYLSVPVQTLRDAILDITDAYLGRDALGSRVPWLVQAREIIDEVWKSANALYDTFLELVGVARKDVPTFAQVLAVARDVIKSVRLGFIDDKGEAPFPWLKSIGGILRTAERALIAFYAILYNNRDLILSLANFAMRALADGLEAINHILKGESIGGDNLFSFLDRAIPAAKQKVDDFRSYLAESLHIDPKASWGQVVVSAFKAMKQAATDAAAYLKLAWSNLKTAFDAVYPVLQKVASALGFKDKDGNGDVAQLAVVFLILKFTGLLDILKDVAQAAGGFGLALSSGLSIGQRLLPVILGFLFSLPGLISVTIYVWYAYWDKIKLGAIYMFDDVKEAASDAWDSIVGVFGKATEWFAQLWTDVVEGATDFWNWLVGLASDAWNGVVSAWDGVVEWFAGLWTDIVDTATGFWDAIVSSAQGAWDGITSIWSRLGSFFQEKIDGVKQAFQNLWDTIKAGAGAAWNYILVKLHLRSDAQPDVATEPGEGSGLKVKSYDVGGVVGGAEGQGQLAMVHGGERILTTAETPIFDRMMAALGGLVVPDTDFTSGPLGVPAGAGGGLPLSPFRLPGGVTEEGFYGTPGALRELRISQSRASTARGRTLTRAELMR